MKGEGVILEGTRPKDDLEVTLTYRKVTHMYVYYILQKGEQLSPSQEKISGDHSHTELGDGSVVAKITFSTEWSFSR